MELNRRNFLKVLGAGSATAALAGCGAEPPEAVIPYVIPPEQFVPGEATWYATVCRECPAGCGMLVKTMEGRAVKVEGNPDHPVNRGKLCPRGHASLQGLYNPDRIRQPLAKGAEGKFETLSWEEGEKRLGDALAQVENPRDRIVFVTGLVGESTDSFIDTWLNGFGGGRHLRYEPVSYESLREASRLAFGIDAIPYYDIESADLVLSFGADFLATWLSPVLFAGQYASMKAYRQGSVGRMAHIGPRLSLTGANADEWIAVRPGAEELIALGMIHVILAEGLSKAGDADQTLRRLVEPYEPRSVAREVGVAADKIRVLARAFAAAPQSLALTDGKNQNGTQTALAVHLLNYAAGNIGKAVRFDTTSAEGNVSSYAEMQALLNAMEEGEISVLLLAGVNPVFSLPEGKRFRATLDRIPLVVNFASFPDETADASHLIMPDHTFLESWGDFAPWEGMRGLQQPVMRPLHDTRSLIDTLIAVAARAGREGVASHKDAYTYLRKRWEKWHQRLSSDEDFESFWTSSVQRGGVFETSTSASRVALQSGVQNFDFTALGQRVKTEALTLVAYPSPFFYDGRGANRPWLQELPDPLTNIVWDSWVEIHPATAKRLGVEHGDVVRVESASGSIDAAAYLTDFVHTGVACMPMGQGHVLYGRYAQGRGANPMPAFAEALDGASGGLSWAVSEVRVTPVGRRHELVTAGGSTKSQGREIVQTMPLATLQSAPPDPKERHPESQVYPEHEHPRHRWGMTIDVNACIGCGACVTACYAENNIPVMGKEQVRIGREMSWIRIQRVDEEAPASGSHNFLPMLCQQCDYAPCEPVCPVYATYHNPEGLNAQIYNRCVGTRYCSNNCPYKVRRFNWFDTEWPEPLNLQLNPDVSVRTAGVMEKCTFCVQRIRTGQLRAKAEGREVRDGEIVPACAQTCPTEAIVFGDLKDSGSRVSTSAKDARAYRVLEQLNTGSAVVYLKKIKSGPIGS